MKLNNKLLLKLFVFLLCTSLIKANETCIDYYLPSAPESLFISGFANKVILEWGVATDKPACGGVSYYNIYRNNEIIGKSENLIFTDTNVSYGEYLYSVEAVDSAGHQGRRVEEKFNITSSIQDINKTINKTIKLHSKSKNTSFVNISISAAINNSYINLSLQKETSSLSDITGDFAGIFEKMGILRIMLLIIVIIFMLVIIILRSRQLIKSEL